MISALELIYKQLAGKKIIPGLVWDNDNLDWFKLNNEYIIKGVDGGLDCDGHYMLILTISNGDDSRNVMYSFNDSLPLKFIG